MKKILALLIAVVMVFSMAAIPASAALSDSIDAVSESFNAGDYESTITGVIELAKEFVAAIHDLVGSIMAVLGEECAFCEEIHVLAA